MLNIYSPLRLDRSYIAFLVISLAITREGAALEPPNETLTAVPGLRVGHYEMAGRPTGCTVVLTPEGTVGAFDVRGGAPGTRETDLLRPENSVQTVDAIVLAGGSAFGLEAAIGTVDYLEAQGRGFATGVAHVPIVPSAILYDLEVGSDPSIRPDATCGYRAAERAQDGPVVEGDVGAGAGATVGKALGMARAMKAGVGSAKITFGEVVVGALVVVNAVGDVIDPSTGTKVAGLRTEDGGRVLGTTELLRAGAFNRTLLPLTNTTLAVVGTNLRLSKVEATKVAQMAHDGLARALSPVHTPFDGDIVFVLSTGTIVGTPDLFVLGSAAADAVAKAIVRAALVSEGLPGLPSARQLGTGPH